MKYLLISSLLFSTLAFALPNDKMTDIETPNNYKKEVYGLATSDFECNLYIEKSGSNLLKMSEAELKNDIKTVSSEFFVFLKNSNNAIEFCKYISDSVVSDMINIQEGVTAYYNEKFKNKKVKLNDKLSGNNK
jgi:rRNA pseudouridine-1189 N-methylase Emg1 (Nep1/Mra1 family)